MARLSGFVQQHSSADFAEAAPLNSYFPCSRNDIPELSSQKLACCCGQNCAFSKQCNTSLSELQKDLLAAAQAGQALLVRHEAYVVDSEQERRELAGTIKELQMEKDTVEVVNAKLLEENQQLQTQLEELNRSTADSDMHVKSLDATLRSTRQELHRLSGLASRTVQLETQLHAMECEIAQLQQVAVSAQEQEKVAVQRWKSAERSLQAMHDEVERIERKTEEERELHNQVIARLERKQLVDAELKTAVEELPKYDSRTSQSRSAHNSNVISHFVQDLLQDNTNLQASMVELRDMLLASHEENERLTEELRLYQPALAENKRGLFTPSLAEDLHLDSLKSEAREMHIHHQNGHDLRNTKGKSPRRPSAKGCADGVMQFSSAALSTPHLTSTPHVRRHLTSSAATAVSPISMIASKAESKRENSHTPSSIFSMSHSPQRVSFPYNRTARDSGIGLSLPATPGNDEPTTPTPALSRRGGVSERLFLLSRKAPTSPLKPAVGKSEPGAQCLTAEGVKGSGLVARLDLAASQGIADLQTVPGHTTGVDKPTSMMTGHRSPLRQSSSHESLLSISGMDIHTLRARPSRPIITGSGLLPRTTSQTPSVSAAPISDKPVMGAMATAARPSLVRDCYDSSTYNRSILQGSGRSRAAEGSVAFKSGQSRDTFTRKLGSWVWGKWATGSDFSTENLRGKAAQSEKSADPPGKGDSGSTVKSSSPPPETAKVTATDLNEILLRESLVE